MKKALDLSVPLEIIDFLVCISLFMEVKSITTPNRDDLEDVKFLQATIASKASYLISGDKHLLSVGEYEGGYPLKNSTF
jgi:predicted nucleic acid-binding protein